MQLEEKMEMPHIIEGWSSHPRIAVRAGVLVDGNITLKVMYSNVDGLIAGGKVLEFKDCIMVCVPDIAGGVETKLTSEISSHLFCPQWYMIARKVRDSKR